MNYRKLLNGSALIALLTACASQLPKDQFALEGTILGVDGQEIYLIYALNDTANVCDTAVVANGKFRFDGELKKPVAEAALFMGDSRIWDNKRRCTVYLEPAAMTVSIDTASFAKAVITGSLTQAQADSLNMRTGELEMRMISLYTQLQAEKDTEKRSAVQQQVEEIRRQIDKITMDFIHTHPNSFLNPLLMRMRISRMSYGELKAVYESFSDKVKQFGDVKEIRDELAALERVQPGQPAPDISKEDINGNMVSLSSLKGKVVLLDFWASWCVPCRKSFPHVKALFEKYHDKGLEVFCVADNDSQPDVWKKAVEDDGLQKFYHVLRGLRQYRDENGKLRFDKSNDVSEYYAVHYLPTKYLIDRDGKIIGKFDEEEELDAKLKELFE